MSGELTQFEQKSAVVPKQTPYAIIGGSILAFIVFLLVSMFAKNEAVKETQAKAQSSETQAVAPSAGGNEDLDI